MLILCYKLPSICRKVTDAALWISALYYVCVFFYHILYIKEIGHWGIQQLTHTNQRMTPPHHQTFVSSNYLLLAHILSDPIIFLTI